MGTGINLQADCLSVLHDCDAALQAQIKVNDLQKQIIADQDSRYALQSKELQTEQIWKPLAEGGAVVILVETLLLVLRK